jgi:hypothetical protein
VHVIEWNPVFAAVGVQEKLVETDVVPASGSIGEKPAPGGAPTQLSVTVLPVFGSVACTGKLMFCPTDPAIVEPQAGVAPPNTGAEFPLLPDVCPSWIRKSPADLLVASLGGSCAWYRVV